ncbi:MAG: leucine-rich repeat domain-containing protein [Firmicutes bacterium]|nr:leucine-rich repeat domain-containing protein [Bacillota bacterium]
MQNKQNTKAKVIVVAIAILLCLALAVGITGAFYQARRRATGTVKMDKGIVIDYTGFGKTPNEGTWLRETTISFKLFEDSDVQPGEKISPVDSGIRANASSVDFYARVKLSYEFYNGETKLETLPASFKASDLITTSATFFGSDWVKSSDGYHYYGVDTTLNKFTKATPATFVDLFDTNAMFIIEGAGFTGAYPDGEGGGFVIGDTSINKIVVYLTLETLQGDATAEQSQALGWEIVASAGDVVFADATAKLETSVGKVETTENLNVSVGGAAEVPLNEVVFPYDTTTTLKFDSNNVEYVTLTYSNGESETFTEAVANSNTYEVYADSSKGTVTAYTIGTWSSSEYNDFIYSDKTAYEDPEQDILVFAPMEDGIALTGYFGTATSLTIPSSLRVRERDFKIVVEGYSSLEEFYNTAEAKIMSIKYPCTFNGSQTLNTERDLFDILDSIGSMTDKEFMEAYPTMEFKFKTLCVTTSILYSKQTVKEIDYGSLAGLSIESVTIPGSVEFIDYGAFSDCANLTTVVMNEGLKTIGENAFYNCSSLTTINIPNGVTSIKNSAFRDCSQLATIIIPDSIIRIEGSDAFYSCANLQPSITKNGIAYLGNESNPYVVAWKTTGKTQTSYAINNGCKVIYYDCFRDCSSATEITIPDTVASIENSAFYGCVGITSIVIPNNVINIGRDAFSSCKLSSINIPASVTSIGSDAFNRNAIETINVAEGNTIYQSSGNCLIETASKTLIFGCKNSIIPTDGSVTSIGDSAFSGCSGLISINIPDNVTSIGGNAFWGCSGLTSIIIPSNIAKIGSSAFEFCENLQPSTTEGNIAYLGNESNLYVVAWKVTDKAQTSYAIKDGCKIIYSNLFRDCTSATSINIPNSVVDIGQSAFTSCSSLSQIVIPEGIESLDNCFNYCGNLTSVTIPDSLVYIQASTFSNCTSLTMKVGDLPGHWVRNSGEAELDDNILLKDLYYPIKRIA